MTKFEYYRRLWEIFQNYKKKKAVLPYLPIRLWIEPTSFCNLKCVMCPNKDLDAKDKGRMTFELFRKIVDEAKNFIHEANLIHRGESLLHPEFFEMVRYAADAGIVTKLHTNGTLLDETKARAPSRVGLGPVDLLLRRLRQGDLREHPGQRASSRGRWQHPRLPRAQEGARGRRNPMTILELIDFPDIYKNVNRAEKKSFSPNSTACRWTGSGSRKCTTGPAR